MCVPTVEFAEHLIWAWMSLQPKKIKYITLVEWLSASFGWGVLLKINAVA